MITKATELLKEIKTENELPSDAGKYFVELMRVKTLGYRELRIVADWIIEFIEMSQAEKENFLNAIDE